MSILLHILSVLTFSAASLLSLAPAHAQPNETGLYKAAKPETQTTQPQLVEFLANIMYIRLAKDILEGNPKHFDFVPLRSQYLKTRQYDPLGESTLKRMRALAYTVHSSTYPQEIEITLEKYNSLLLNHVANIGIVAQAIAFSKEDPRFGDVEKLQRIRDGLLQSVLKNGDGLTLATAFEIVTLAEEIAMLQNSRQKVISTRLIERGIMRYNVHEIITADGINGITYTNVTFPMRHLERRGKEQRRAIDPRRR